MAGPSRQRDRHAFEQDAELLVVYHLDLLVQLERQLRAVHQTMRCIEQLRNTKHRRPAPESSNGQRHDALNALADEVTAIDTELHTQHRSCQDMQQTIEQMLVMLARWRQAGPGASREATRDAEGPG